jgi:hypothetical protein
MKKICIKWKKFFVKPLTESICCVIIDESKVFYDIRIRNQKILKKAPNNGGGMGGGNPFDF